MSLTPLSTPGMRTQSDVVQEVLVLTDGQSNCHGAVASAAKQLQRKATVFSLLIGSFTLRGVNEISSYVTTPVPKHLFAVKQLQDLDSLVVELRKQRNTQKCMAFDLP